MSRKIILIVIFVLFFIIYSYLPLSQIFFSNVPMTEVSMRFNTPDEVTNFYFTNLFSNENKLYYFENYNLLINGAIFPRWAKPIGDKIVLGTFQGIILIYGSLAKIFSNFIISFLTPIFALIGVVFFYNIIKMIFNKKIAIISGFLMLTFPAYVYYSSRVMFHNVLFLTLLFGGLYFLLKLFSVSLCNFKRDFTRIKYFYAVLAGLFLGLGLITRTSEIVWMFLLVSVFLLFNLKLLKNYYKYILLILIISILCFVPVLINNKNL